MTPQLKAEVFRQQGLQQSCTNDAGGEILEEMAYWRHVEEEFGGQTSQDLDKKLLFAGVTISACLCREYEYGEKGGLVSVLLRSVERKYLKTGHLRQ